MGRRQRRNEEAFELEEEEGMGMGRAAMVLAGY